MGKSLHGVEGRMVIQAVTVLGNAILYNKGEMVDKRVSTGWRKYVYENLPLGWQLR